MGKVSYDLYFEKDGETKVKGFASLAELKRYERSISDRQGVSIQGVTKTGYDAKGNFKHEVLDRY